jgi:hypothetical protein
MKLREWHRWLLIVGAVIVLDLAGRFALDFDVTRVLILESLLFAGACIVVVVVATRRPREAVASRRVGCGLGAAFGLAALRTTLWSVGVNIAVANMVVLAGGVALVAGLLIRRRYVARRHTGS